MAVVQRASSPAATRNPRDLGLQRIAGTVKRGRERRVGADACVMRPGLPASRLPRSAETEVKVAQGDRLRSKGRPVVGIGMWLISGLVLLAAPCPLMAQVGPAAPVPQMDGDGGRHGGRQRDSGPPAPSEPALSAKPGPRQRLDPGAWLCRTEAALQQHQAAMAARLEGREGVEPVGCRPVTALTVVSVVERHGPAATEVRVPGQPDPVGWTDAIVRNK